MPRWSDFSDPLEAISARFRDNISERAAAMKGPPATSAERKALKLLGLEAGADKTTIRRAYSAKLRAYHPDRNGGDRSKEKQLQAVVEAYQLLKKSG